MSVFSSPHYDDHEHVTFFRDPAAGLSAIVAIHTTAPFGIAGGGCRMWPYASDDAALDDALRLSRAMSYKLALFDMPAGGAKCVVIADPRRDKTEALLLALGRMVERLGGKYVIAEDVGTTEEDMRIVARETKYVVGKSTDTGPATAYGAFLGIKEGVRRVLGRDDLKGVRVGVQGLGGVGRRLADHLARAGADLVVADVNSDAVDAITRAMPVRAVLPQAILAEEVDVLAPCALGAVLDDTSIPELRCKLIAGAANNQLAEDRHAEAIAARGIVFLPDFVLNAGGVIGASQEGKALGGVQADGKPVYDESVAFSETQAVAKVLREVMERAAREAVTPNEAAIRLAKEKIRERAGG
jgi:leucine dehydrogenase